MQDSSDSRITERVSKGYQTRVRNAEKWITLGGFYLIFRANVKMGMEGVRPGRNQNFLLPFLIKISCKWQKGSERARLHFEKVEPKSNSKESHYWMH
jgi:hypothetical protein